MNPVDSFLWGRLEFLIYVIPIENIENVRNRIVALCKTIRNTFIFQRTCQSIKRRTNKKRFMYNIMAGGGIISTTSPTILFNLVFVTIYFLKSHFLNLEHSVTRKLWDIGVYKIFLRNYLKYHLKFSHTFRNSINRAIFR